MTIDGFKFKLNFFILKIKPFTSLFKQMSNKKIATHNFNFSGILVTYTCWSYMVMFILFTFLLYQLTACIFLGGTLFGAFLLVVCAPFVLTMLAFKCIQRCLSTCAARHCFLQSSGKKYLALKNARAYNLFLYFRLFYDCFTGVAFCGLRMLANCLFCILYLPRIDIGISGGGNDVAHMAYVAHLKWEAQHTNPIMVCFCQMLEKRNSFKNKKKTNNELLSNNQNTNRRRRNILRNRWYLYYFMTKNSILLSYRRKMN
jgi:hypothetical protein